MRRIATTAALLALCLVLPNACIVVEDGGTDSASGSVAVVDLDSAKRASDAPLDPAARARAEMQRVVDSAAMQHMSDSVRAALALDSMRPMSTEEVPAYIPPVGGKTGPRDTAPVNASPSELASLASQLTIPVQGIAVRDLRDSYAEPRGGGSRSHQAIDIPAPHNTPVLAATNGRILRKFSSRDGGNMIYSTDASEKFILMYAHLDHYADNLADGMTVRQGDIIGYVGTTGNAPPGLPHLHFAIARASDIRDWWRGTPINPFPLLASHGG
jgi:murein DD-endopeptidase MepM/ murein hydrolase activator NlpD